MTTSHSVSGKGAKCSRGTLELHMFFVEFAFKCTNWLHLLCMSEGDPYACPIRAARQGWSTVWAASNNRRSWTPAWQRPHSAPCSAEGTRAPPAHSACRICGETREEWGQGERTEGRNGIDIIKSSTISSGDSWQAKKNENKAVLLLYLCPTFSEVSLFGQTYTTAHDTKLPFVGSRQCFSAFLKTNIWYLHSHPLKLGLHPEMWFGHRRGKGNNTTSGNGSK